MTNYNKHCIIAVLSVITGCTVVLVLIFGILFLISESNERDRKEQEAYKAWTDSSFIYKLLEVVDKNPQRFCIEYTTDMESEDYLINWGVLKFTVIDKQTNNKYLIKFDSGLHRLSMYRNGKKIYYSEHYYHHLKAIKYFTDACKKHSKYHMDLEANKMLLDLGEPAAVITSTVSDNTIEINVQQSNQNKKNIELNAN